jgi:hypothetical protein
VDHDAGPHPDSPACGCALCGRHGTGLTRHHLLPQARSRRMKRGKAWKRKLARQGQDLRQQARRTALLCPACHRMVHATFTEVQLQRDYASLEQLRRHPGIARFVAWVRRQPTDRRVSVHWTSARRAARGPKR